MSIITIGGSTGSGNGTTFGDMIENVYSRMIGDDHERIVTIDQLGGIGSDDETVVVLGAQANLIVPGTHFAVDMEEMYVSGWDAGSNTATIVRGYGGSTPASHENGALVYLDPRFSRFAIGVAINDGLRSMSSAGLFRVGQAQVTYNSAFIGYDLGDVPSNFLNVLNVRYKVPTGQRDFPRAKRWKVDQVLEDALFPSGQALFIREGFPGQPVYVTYSAPFISLVDPSDSVLMTPATNDQAPPYNGYQVSNVPNLAVTMIDIPCLYAEIDLIQPREISRNNMGAQPDPRLFTDVPPGAIGGAANALMVKLAKRLDEEVRTLSNRYPRLRTW